LGPLPTGTRLYAESGRGAWLKKLPHADLRAQVDLLYASMEQTVHTQRDTPGIPPGSSRRQWLSIWQTPTRQDAGGRFSRPRTLAKRGFNLDTRRCSRCNYRA
jgi:hypothetical protein